MKLHYLIAVSMLLPVIASGQDKKPQPNADMSRVKLVGTTAHEPINEMSGIVKSQTYPDVYWVNNDSGDIPRVFAVRRDGSAIVGDVFSKAFHGEIAEEGKTPWPGIEVLLAANQDWEDIAVHDGKLYIADLGNNANYRRDMGVYVLYEPNPEVTIRTRVLQHIPVRYPDQKLFPAERWHFDSEAMFVVDGKLHFLTKHRAPGKHTEWEAGVNLYRLDTMDTSEANVLTKVDSHDQVALATGADMSPNGKHLAIITYGALWVFDAPRSKGMWLSGRTRMLPLDYTITQQAEAVCWDDDETILLSNEQRQIFEVRLADVPHGAP